MDRDDAVAALESAAMAAVLYGVILLLPGLIPSPFGFTLVILGLMVAAAAMLGACYLPTFRLAESGLPPPYLRAYLAYGLRREGYRVEESPEYLTARLGSLAALRVHVRATPQGSAVSTQAFATSSGWGTLVALTIIPEAAPVAVGVTLYAFRKSRRFARRTLLPLVRGAKTSPTPPVLDDVHALLVNGLSEGQRLAAESYEAQRSAYSDSLVVLGLATVLVWFLALVIVVFLTPQPFITRDWTVPVVVATASASVPPLVVGRGLWRRVRPQIRIVRAWMERFRTALARETVRAPPEPPEPSSVELLLAASKEIPSWLEHRRWAGLSGDQAAGWVVFLLTAGAVSPFEYSVFAALQGDVVGAVLGALGGVALSTAAWVYWRRWKQRQDAAIRQAEEEWRRRTDALSVRLNEFLEGL